MCLKLTGHKSEFWFRFFLDSFFLLGSGMAVKSPFTIIMAKLFRYTAFLWTFFYFQYITKFRVAAFSDHILGLKLKGAGYEKDS